MASRNELLNDPEEALRVAMDGRISSVWTALPGIISKVNLGANTVEVQPAIQGIIENPDGTTKNVNMPLLVDVPIVFPSAGGFSLTFPIKVGDEVLVILACRCIDSWWQSGGIGIPAEARMHDLSDGFAIPGPKSQPKKIASISSNNVQLRNDAGDTYLEITPSGMVKIKATIAEIEAPTINLKGAVEVTGEIKATTAIIGGIPFGTHRHTGVSTGPGTSGGPV